MNTTTKGDANAWQSPSPDRKSDTGPIPAPMIDDLRRLVWRMENLTLYWAIGMGIILGGVWIAGTVFFLTADQQHPRIDHTSIGIGVAALTVLVVLLYSPFLNRWDTSRFAARWLREALYSRRLEDLSDFMASCRMGSRGKIADDLLAIWLKHELEPGWSARPIQPKPLFR